MRDTKAHWESSERICEEEQKIGVSVVAKEAVKRKLDYDSSERWGDGPRRPHLRGRKDKDC